MPKLESLLRKEKEIGRPECMRLMNNVLDKREDIKELVSYGLILASEEMQTLADRLIVCCELLDQLSDIAENETPLTGKEVRKLERYHAESNDMLKTLPLGVPIPANITIFGEGAVIKNFPHIVLETERGNRILVASDDSLKELEMKIAEAFQRRGVQPVENDNNKKARDFSKHHFEAKKPADPVVSRLRSLDI